MRLTVISRLGFRGGLIHKDINLWIYKVGEGSIS